MVAPIARHLRRRLSHSVDIEVTMTSDCKKPTTGFWIAVALVAVLVLYVLGFGPVAAHWRSGIKSGLTTRLIRVYAPMFWVLQKSPEPFRSALRWYVSLWD